MRIKKKRPKGKTVLKKRPNKIEEKKKRYEETETETASPGVEPGLSAGASNSLTTTPH